MVNAVGRCNVTRCRWTLEEPPTTTVACCTSALSLRRSTASRKSSSWWPSSRDSAQSPSSSPKKGVRFSTGGGRKGKAAKPQLSTIASGRDLTVNQFQSVVDDGAVFRPQTVDEEEDHGGCSCCRMM